MASQQVKISEKYAISSLIIKDETNKTWFLHHGVTYKNNTETKIHYIKTAIKILYTISPLKRLGYMGTSYLTWKIWLVSSFFMSNV